MGSIGVSITTGTSGCFARSFATARTFARPPSAPTFTARTRWCREDLGDLRGEVCGGDVVHAAKTRRRLHGEDGHRRAPEGSRRGKRAKVGRDARAPARVESPDRERARSGGA